jgi:MOSC domain-containing protein YiiM
MGENITTRGLDLLSLPKGTKLYLGSDAIVEVTGLRNPCEQLNTFQDGLMNLCVYKDENGNIVRKAGIMSIVLAGGEVRAGDAIRVELPPGPHEALQVV